jgi:hypothetical protein
MNDDLKDEAAEMLERIISEHRFDKSGEDLLAEICRFYKPQSENCKASIEDVFETWLINADNIKAGWAIDLISRLKITRKLKLLENTLREIKAGQSELPAYYVEFLEPAIEDIQNGGVQKHRNGAGDK